MLKTVEGEKNVYKLRCEAFEGGLPSFNIAYSWLWDGRVESN